MLSNILITSVGSMSTECVATSLNNQGYSLYGTDIYPEEWLGVGHLFSKIYRVPKANHKDYISELLSICLFHNVGYIFPLTDPEVDILSKFRDLFAKHNIVVCVSGQESILIMRDKLKISYINFNMHNVHTLKTFTKENIAQLDVQSKIIAKPRYGRSSEGQKIYNEINEINDCNDEYVFQNIMVGDIFVVDYIRDEHNNDYCVIRKELLRTKNGAGTSVFLCENATLKLASELLGKILDIKGAVNFEFIFDGSNYFLMDINPRFSAGIAFTQLTGFDYVLNHFKCFTGENIIIPQTTKTDFFATKRFSTYIVEGKTC